MGLAQDIVTQSILGGSGGHIIENEGVELSPAPVLNFEGAGVDAAKVGEKIVVTIPGGGGGGSSTDRVFIYNPEAPTAGNSYATMTALLSAGAAYPGPKTLVVAPTTPGPASVLAGSYNFSEYDVIAKSDGDALFGVGLDFADGTTITGWFRTLNTPVTFNNMAPNGPAFTHSSGLLILSILESGLIDNNGDVAAISVGAATLYLFSKSFLGPFGQPNSGQEIIEGTDADNSEIQVFLLERSLQFAGSGNYFKGTGSVVIFGVEGTNYSNGSSLNPAFTGPIGAGFVLYGPTIQYEGESLTQLPRINFTGAGVSAFNSGGGTIEVNIPGGGGGGGAYPEPVTLHNSAGMVNLTTEMQGTHAPNIAGVEFTLPAVAADGTTFKISTYGFPAVVYSAPAIVIPTVTTTTRLPVGRTATFTAINVAPLGLVWQLINLPNISEWANDVTYARGEIVTHEGNMYMNIFGSNTANTPSPSSLYWFLLSNASAGSYTVQVLDSWRMTWTGTPPADFISGVAKYVSVGKLYHVYLQANYATAGSGNTGVIVDLGGMQPTATTDIRHGLCSSIEDGPAYAPGLAMFDGGAQAFFNGAKAAKGFAMSFTYTVE